MIESAKPNDEVEAVLIIQMASTHTAAMAVLSRISGAHGGDRHVAVMAAATSKLLRAYTIQVETFAGCAAAAPDTCELSTFTSNPLPRL